MTIQFNREWKVKVVQDFLPNISNKLFTVPTLKDWLIQSIQFETTTNATAGNRQFEVLYLDAGSNKLATSVAGLAQPPSTNYFYTYTLNGLDSIALRDSNKVSAVLPHMILTDTMKIRVYDNKGISPFGSGENIFISMTILERDKEL